MSVVDCRYEVNIEPAQPSSSELFTQEITAVRSELLEMVQDKRISEEAFVRSMANTHIAVARAEKTVAFDCLPRRMVFVRTDELIAEALAPANMELDENEQGGLPQLSHGVTPTLRHLLSTMTSTKGLQKQK